MQPQQNNNKQSRSSSRNTSSSSTRGFSTSRSRRNASSTTRVFSDPTPVVFQQQGVSSSNTSSSTPVVSQQQTFHPVSIDLRTTSITQLPKHLTKILSKKPSKTKLSPVMERNSNPDSLKRYSNSGGVSEVFEVDFASIMSEPEDLLIPEFLRTPPRQISPEVSQLDMVNISTDLQEHDGFGDELLETYLPNYFHDMPTIWDQPEEIPEPDMTHLVTTNIQPDILVPVTPPLPFAQERNSNPSDLKRNSNSGGKTKIYHNNTESMPPQEIKLTNTTLCECLKCIHDSYKYISVQIPTAIETSYLQEHLGSGTLEEHRRKINEYVCSISDAKYQNLEKYFNKTYGSNLMEYAEKIKDLVRKDKNKKNKPKKKHKRSTPTDVPILTPVIEDVVESSPAESIEFTPPPKPKPVVLSAAVQAKILVNRCRQASRLPPLNVPEECTMEELTEAVRKETAHLDQKVQELEADLEDLKLQEAENQDPDILEQKAEEIPTILMTPQEINKIPVDAPLEPLESFNSPLPPDVILQEPEVEEFTVAYAEYAGICEEMGLEPKEMADFSDFKEIDAEIDRLALVEDPLRETPKALLQMKAAAEPKPEPKDPTPEPDADAVKVPESEEDEQDDEDPISDDRKTQLVQVFARYSKMPTDVFLLVIDYLLQMELYVEAAAVVKAHHRLLETEIPYCLKHMSRVFLNYFDHFYNVKEIPSYQCYKTDEYGLMVMMRDNIYKMQERRYRYATSHRPMIEYLLADSKRVKELKGIIDAEHSQLNVANQMAIENMPEEYADVDVNVWQHKSQKVTALHELGSPEYVPQNEREQKFQEQLQNSKAVQSRNKKKQKRKEKLADLHAAAEPKDPKRDPDTDAPKVCVESLPVINLDFVGGSRPKRKRYQDEPTESKGVDFSFVPPTSIFSRAQLREYSRRDQRPINTAAVRYKSSEGVQIVEPEIPVSRFPIPKPRKPRKSIRPRVDPYQQRAEAALRAPPLPRSGQVLEEVQFVPETYSQSVNKRSVKSQDKYKEIAQFDEEGDVILIEPKKKGRPSKPKHLHKYQKKFSKRGRPKKGAKPEVSPPWTPAVLPVNLWYSPTAFLQGIPEPQPVDPAITEAYGPHREEKQDTFNDEIEPIFMEPPNRLPKYSWEDRRHWERKRIAREYENDFQRRFYSTGLQPMSEAPRLVPPPPPIIRPVEPLIARERMIPLEPPPAPRLGPVQLPEEKLEPPPAPRLRPVPAPRRKTKRQIQQEALQAEQDQNQLEAQELYLAGRNLGIPYLSNNLRRVFKRSIEIKPGQVWRDTSFVWDYDQGSLLEASALGPVNIFERQTEHMVDFILQTIRRAISRWRYLIHYSSINGSRTVSTSWVGSYITASEDIVTQIKLLMELYGEEEIQIDQFELRVVNTTQVLFGGMTSKELQTKIEELKQKWIVINPSSKTNCLWTSIAIADGYKNNADLIYDTSVQNKAGGNLKIRVGTRNEKGGCEEDLDKCSTYKGRNIVVYDDFTEIKGTFMPDSYKIDPETQQPASDIHLLLMHGHYHALLPKEDPMVQEHAPHIKEQEDHYRDIKAIPKFKKDLDRRRIVAYDLESYKDPRIGIRANGSMEEEMHQIAYACAWAFIIESKEEETYCRDHQYEVLEYKYQDKDIAVAYQHKIGARCLDESLEIWCSEPIFHEAVFYAHNGGKYDARLILGQSNLLYREKYNIKPDKTIELNGRIINLDIENITQKYEKEQENSVAKTSVYHYISIRDSIPLFGPGNSLAKLCKEMRVPHQKMEELINVHDLQYSGTWRNNWNQYHLDEYLRNDVLGLLEVLTHFDDRVVAGTGIPITAVNTGASLAKKYFLKHSYQKDGKTSANTIYTLDKSMDSFIREGYGGGRCEAFVSKEIIGNLYYYDFTSLYPDVGRLNMPTGKPKWLVDPSLPNMQRTVAFHWRHRVIEGNIGSRQMFWKVRVRSPLAAEGTPMDSNLRKPLFGMKEQDMYIFRWYSEWTEMVIYEPEITFALDYGLDYEFEPINGIVFESSTILKDCMEELFKKKAEATENDEEALAKTWKIIINSLYGVWGLRVQDREGIEIARPEKSNWAVDMVTDRLMDLEKIGRYIVTRRVRDLEVKDCNVAIAAAVTSYARIKLYSLFMDIQDAGGKILYCDTDSIITDYCIENHHQLKDKWIGPSDGKDLGSLKNEVDKCYDKLIQKYPHIQRSKAFDKAVIVAPKLYILTAAEDQIIKKAHKGYKEDVSNGDIVTYERMKLLVDPIQPEDQRVMIQTTDQWLGGNRDIILNEIGVRIVKRTKQIRQTVHKGVLQEDGSIVPYINTLEKIR